MRIGDGLLPPSPKTRARVLSLEGVTRVRPLVEEGPIAADPKNLRFPDQSSTPSLSVTTKVSPLSSTATPSGLSVIEPLVVVRLGLMSKKLFSHSLTRQRRRTGPNQAIWTRSHQ